MEYLPEDIQRRIESQEAKIDREGGGGRNRKPQQLQLEDVVFLADRH
jgi:hypothetical protein